MIIWLNTNLVLASMTNHINEYYFLLRVGNLNWFFQCNEGTLARGSCSKIILASYLSPPPCKFYPTISKLNILTVIGVYNSL